MDVDGVIGVKILGWKGFARPAVFENGGVGGEGFEGEGVEAAGGVVDEDDVAEGGDRGGGEGLAMEIRGEGLEKGEVGTGWLAGQVGFGADNEAGGREVVERGDDLLGVEGWVQRGLVAVSFG